MEKRRCRRCKAVLKDVGNPWHNRALCLDCWVKDHRARKLLVSKAHYWVQKAQKKGILAKLDGTVKCVDCRYPAWVYDHRDYRKPTEVEPVCHSCNWNRGPALPLTGTCRLFKRARIRFQKREKIRKKIQCADTLPLT